MARGNKGRRTPAPKAHLRKDMSPLLAPHATIDLKRPKAEKRLAAQRPKPIKVESGIIGGAGERHSKSFTEGNSTDAGKQKRSRISRQEYRGDKHKTASQGRDEFYSYMKSLQEEDSECPLSPQNLA